MRINNNLMAMNTHRQLGINAAEGSKSIEKLSSGLRINRAGDDAAGLSISEKMRSQIRGLNMASKNAQDGISLVQTAEGALQESQAILQRMRELGVQASTGTNTDTDRDTIQSEISQLKSEIDRIGDTTEFNTKKLLNGELKSAGSASIGANQTTGAAVAKLVAGKFTGVGSMASLAAVDADFVKETIKIDGVDIDVHWENLSTEDKNTLKNVGTDATSLTAAKDVIVNTVNAAIDASGANVEHITGYTNTSKQLVLESGTSGTKSKIAFGAAGVLKHALSGGTSAVGTSKYNGTTVAASTKADMYVGNILIKLSMTGAITGGTTNMTSAATELKSAINVGISAYNKAAGKTQGQEGYIEKVTVAATDDGRLQINSQTAEIRFVERAGNTMVKDLGLTEAQASAAGNGGVTFQIGANKDQTLQFGIGDMRSAALGITGVDVSTTAKAANAISTIDKALSKVSEERSKLGAVQNRLEHTIKNLDTSAENLQSSESRIRDVDMAKEMMNFTKTNILQQAAQAMLAQANQAPQGVLQLLR